MSRKRFLVVFLILLLIALAGYIAIKFFVPAGLVVPKEVSITDFEGKLVGNEWTALLTLSAIVGPEGCSHYPLITTEKWNETTAEILIEGHERYKRPQGTCSMEVRAVKEIRINVSKYFPQNKIDLLFVLGEMKNKYELDITPFFARLVPIDATNVKINQRTMIGSMHKGSAQEVFFFPEDVVFIFVSGYIKPEYDYTSDILSIGQKLNFSSIENKYPELAQELPVSNMSRFMVSTKPITGDFYIKETLPEGVDVNIVRANQRWR
jgi:hypothetical protein